jgi:hypothetical protein
MDRKLVDRIIANTASFFQVPIDNLIARVDDDNASAGAHVNVYMCIVSSSYI